MELSNINSGLQTSSHRSAVVGASPSFPNSWSTQAVDFVP